MKILVVRWGRLQNLPPAITLIQTLLILGHEVTVVCNEPDVSFLSEADCLSCHDLGPYPRVGSGGHAGKRLSSLRELRRYLKSNVSGFDIVWTTSDNSAVYCCDLIPPEKHVMQLAELVKHVPLIGSKDFLVSKSIIEQARAAKRVVVPEVNRAYIQRIYWDLPIVPAVLPNKPLFDSIDKVRAAYPLATFPSVLVDDDAFKLIYQGGFTPDRNLIPYCKAVQCVDVDARLVLMGQPNSYSKMLCDRYENIFCIGRYEPPVHLLGASFADVGILPYSSGGEQVAHLSRLNALYCAPNKLWEYALAGVPMLANSLPGLRSTIAEYEIGFSVEEGDVDGICVAIENLCSVRAIYEKRCRSFYDSVDVGEVVKEILEY